MKYIIIILNLIYFLSCNGAKEPKNIEKTNHKKKEYVENFNNSDFVYHGDYSDWLKIYSDLFFPIRLYDTGKNIFFKREYFLRKKADWLFLAECDFNGGIINEFPLVPFKKRASECYYNESLKDVFPSPDIYLNKSLSIDYHKVKDTLNTYEIIFKIEDMVEETILSTSDTILSERNEQVRTCTLCININSGDILFYSKNWNYNYIW
jgi:hypothetical protein